MWSGAICHGDFHPNNLISKDECLTGIDTGGSSILPVYKDMARVLVHMGRRAVIPSGQMWLGVDRVGFDAFAEAFAFDDLETHVCLPFMIGVEALLRVENKSLSRGRIRRATAFYTALLADLQRAKGL